MVENLIAGYLATGKRLVIPELGAFLKKETGETVFVEFLKKDDGVFAGLISQSMGIPAADAARQAAEFSAGVRESLAGRGFFIVPRVGTLRRDASGTLNLTPLPAGDTTSPQAGQPTAEASSSTAVVSPGATTGQAPKPKVVPYTPPCQQARVEQYTPPSPGTGQADGQIPGNAAPSRPAAGQPAAPAPTVAEATAQQPRATPERMGAVPQPAARPVVDTPTTTTEQRPVSSAPVSPVPLQERRSPEGTAASHRPARRPPADIPQRRKKTDLVMIIAIVAALIAIGSMVFGLLVNNDPIVNIQPTSPRQEQVVTDTEPAEEAAAEQPE
ncbi:MAG: hypothetical protein LUE26_00150 [Alistipes sp.]|nr:hypothetical protein [Alistipes sp.]